MGQIRVADPEACPGLALFCIVPVALPNLSIQVEANGVSQSLSEPQRGPPMKNERAVQPDLLTVPQVASQLQMGLTATYGLIRSGSIPSVRIGNRIRVPRPAMDRWVNELSAQAGQQVIRF
jgi:excisionase family DNA binding protein